MMNAATLRLVLLLSCCHALVHVYELSFGTVELKVAEEFGVGKDVTGVLASCLRLPFGVCALLTGWLADHLGAKRLLLIYLLGCTGAAALAWVSRTLAVLSVAMFSLGVFASIYHPAGVGLISHETTPENRPMALGYHGIFGSAGIAAGPFLAGLVLITGVAWRQYYLLLSVPGVLLAVLLLLRLTRAQEAVHTADPQTPVPNGDDEAHWASYFTLIFVVSLAGIVYASMVTFMTRYLNSAGLDILSGLNQSLLRRGFGEVDLKSIGVANFLTSAVLLLGILGQFTAGRIAKPTTLEPLMACAFLAAAPCALWMGFAAGTARIWPAGLFALVFFMHQPLFNSLVAKYTPRRRRSLCYGLSFTVSFGIGSIGPAMSGRIRSDLLNFAVLTALLTLAGMLTLVLWRWHGPVQKPQETEEALLV
jgi:FSR family fosmidomycin resistance protein-like MFS transporter